MTIKRITQENILCFFIPITHKILSKILKSIPILTVLHIHFQSIVTLQHINSYIGNYALYFMIIQCQQVSGNISFLRLKWKILE